MHQGVSKHARRSQARTPRHLSQRRQRRAVAQQGGRAQMRHPTTSHSGSQSVRACDSAWREATPPETARSPTCPALHAVRLTGTPRLLSPQAHLFACTKCIDQCDGSHSADHWRRPTGPVGTIRSLGSRLKGEIACLLVSNSFDAPKVGAP